MGISAILFDAGDVIYSKPRRANAIAKFLTDRGHAAPAAKDPVERLMRLKAHAGEIGVREFMTWLMAHYGVTDAKDVADGIDLLRAQQADVVFFDDVPDTLHELKRRGYKLGIVTNTFNPPAEKMKWFKTVGIEKLWDAYADSCDLGVVKPDPRIYQAALDQIGIPPAEAAFVGHSQTELDGAKALGITTVRFNPDLDCQIADYTVPAFRDLLTLPLHL